MSLIKKFLVFHWRAHWDLKVNLISGAFGMIFNNTIFLVGIWGMLYAGKEAHQEHFKSFLHLQILLMASWGLVNFFASGLRDLGDSIAEGDFELRLATPRHPLLLVAFQSFSPWALGDVLMGLSGLIYVFFAEDFFIFGRLLGATLLAIGAWGALFILSGSLSFYFSRGNSLSMLLQEVTISLSSYPMGKVFPGGWGRFILLIFPVGATSISPLEWVERGGSLAFAKAFISVIFLIWFSLKIYNRGVKRFQATCRVSVS